MNLWGTINPFYDRLDCAGQAASRIFIIHISYKTHSGFLLNCYYCAQRWEHKYAKRRGRKKRYKMDQLFPKARIFSLAHLTVTCLMRSWALTQGRFNTSSQNSKVGRRMSQEKASREERNPLLSLWLLLTRHLSVWVTIQPLSLARCLVHFVDISLFSFYLS